MVPQDEHRRIELGSLAQVAFLRRYMSSVDQNATPEEQGGYIDHGLVEYIRMQLSALKASGISIGEFHSKMAQIEEGMRENSALRAFAATLWQMDGAPLASETYLRLAKRHAMHGKRRPPSPKEGRRFTNALLASFKNEALSETDWDESAYTKFMADSWLDSRDPHELEILIEDSEESAVIYDVLQLICNKLADGLAGESAGGPDNEPEECLPYELLEWHFLASHGYVERPGDAPDPRHRPRKLGYKLRNNEFRHNVDLLVEVGMSRTAACQALADAFKLGLSTIQRVSRTPYSTVDELLLDALKRIHPSYYSFPYEPGE